MKKSITMYHMYPELLNLYGDKGNVAVIKMRCEKREIEFNLKTFNIGDTADFSDADIILFGGGAKREIQTVSSYRDEILKPLKDYVEDGGVMLALCEAYQMMGNSYELELERMEGFGILDIDCSKSDLRFTGNVAIETKLADKDVKIVGFENHSYTTNIKNHAPLGRIIYGNGNDGGKYEGVIYKNLIATNLYGPILPKNPELADFLIKTALDRKYKDKNELSRLDDEMEMNAKNFMLERDRA